MRDDDEAMHLCEGLVYLLLCPFALLAGCWLLLETKDRTTALEPGALGN